MQTSNVENIAAELMMVPDLIAESVVKSWITDQSKKHLDLALTLRILRPLNFPCMGLYGSVQNLYKILINWHQLIPLKPRP